MTQQGFKVAGSIISEGAEFNNVTVVNSATYDLTTSDKILSVTYTGTGAVTSLTLPSAQLVSGRTIKIIDSGGNASTYSITIDTEGSEKINGEDTHVIDSDYGVIELISDGSNWFISNYVRRTTRIAVFDAGTSDLTGLTLGDNDPLPIFQREVYNTSSNISINSTTQIILKAGFKYKLFSDVNVTFAAASAVYYQFYNVTGTTAIGIKGSSISVNFGASVDSDNSSFAIIETSADTTIELRIIVTNENITDLRIGCKVIVEEIF